MSEEQKEKIEFQHVMNYKAYRRKMIAVRAAIAVIAAGGLCGFCVYSILLGILLAVIALVLGVIAILISFANEQTYTVYNTRIVFKRRGNDKRVSVPIDSIVKVAYRTAFYEKDLRTGTLTVTARTDKNKLKKYRMKHIFDAAPTLEYINEKISTRGNTDEDRK